MSDKDISISANQVRELFALMEEIQDLFHQPMNYENKDTVIKFADKYYPAIHKAYYKTLWDLLPEEDKEKIRNN